MSITIGIGIKQISSSVTPAPTGLTLALISGGVRISFTDATGGTAEHEIWAKSDSGTSALLTTLSAGDVSYDDIIAPKDLRYYKIRAKYGTSYSVFTAEQSIAMLGIERILNGTFPDASNWTLQAVWSVGGGTLNGNGGSSSYARATNGLNGGAGQYRIRLTVAITSGFFLLDNGADPYVAINASANWDFIYTLTTAPADQLYFWSYGFLGSVDNVSVKKVLFP
jgi:hypothetical protein